MGNFYEKLKKYKSDNRISYKDLGAIIGKNEDAFRMALKRETFSKLEEDKLKELFVNTKNTEQIEDKKSQLSMEDILAKKVLKELEPFFKNLLESHQRIVSELAELSLYVDELKDNCKDVENLVGKIHATVNK